MASQLPNATYRSYGMATSGDTLIYPESDRQYGHYPATPTLAPGPATTTFQVVDLATPTPDNLPAGVYSAYSMTTSGDVVILGAAIGNRAHIYGVVLTEASDHYSPDCLGVARASGAIRAVALVAAAGGRVRCLAAIGIQLLVTAAGIVITSGTITPNVRLLGATSVVTTSGQIPAVALSVTALGIVKTSGGIASTTINAKATAVGIAKTSGSAYLVNIGATALGRVVTLGSATIPLPSGQITCVSGSDGPLTPEPANAVY